MIALLYLALALCIVYSPCIARNHPEHEDCPTCGLWIGDPAWEGEPRACPACGATMEDIPAPADCDDMMINQRRQP